MWDTYRYMNLEGSRDILTRRNTPASTDLEPQERLAKSPPSLSFSLPCASLYAHNCGCKYETGSQYKDRSLESNSRVTEYNIRCFLVGGIIQKRLPRSLKSPQIGAKRGKESQFDLSKKKPLVAKISFEFCAPIAFYQDVPQP